MEGTGLFVWNGTELFYPNTPRRDETAMVMNRGIWWAKDNAIKASARQNYPSLIPVRHYPSFVATTMKTVFSLVPDN